MRLGSTNSPSASLEVKASGATLTSTIWSHDLHILQVGDRAQFKGH